MLTFLARKSKREKKCETTMFEDHSKKISFYAFYQIASENVEKYLNFRAKNI